MNEMRESRQRCFSKDADSIKLTHEKAEKPGSLLREPQLRKRVCETANKAFVTTDSDYTQEAGPGNSYRNQAPVHELNGITAGKKLRLT